MRVSGGREPVNWKAVGAYEDIRLDYSGDGIAKVTICRPEVRNAFRPQTLTAISDALTLAREDRGIGVIVLTGQGTEAFCSGGDQRVRGDTGYLTDPGDADSVGRFHVTDLQVQIRRLPKPVVAMVAGYAIGGKDGPILDIDPFFRWPTFATPGVEAPGNKINSDKFQVGVELGGFFYL